MGLPAIRLTPTFEPARSSPPNRPHRPRTLGRRFEELRRTALTPLEEARSLDARSLPALPLVTVLELEVPGWAGPVWVRGDAAPVRREGADPLLDGLAWTALVEAVELDRVGPADFRALVARLAGEPALDPIVAIAELVDGVRPEAPRGWTVGRVLERLGARLFSVRVDEKAAPDEPLLARAG
jgi:hypothetical protein